MNYTGAKETLEPVNIYMPSSSDFTVSKPTLWVNCRGWDKEQTGQGPLWRHVTSALRTHVSLALSTDFSVGNFPRLIYKDGKRVESGAHPIAPFDFDSLLDSLEKDLEKIPGGDTFCKIPPRVFVPRFTFASKNDEQLGVLKLLNDELNKFEVAGERLRQSRNNTLHLIAAQVQAQEKMSETYTSWKRTKKKKKKLANMRADADGACQAGSEELQGICADRVSRNTVEYALRKLADSFAPSGWTLVGVLFGMVFSTMASARVENKVYVGIGLIVLIGLSIYSMWRQMRKRGQSTEEVNAQRIFSSLAKIDENQ